MGRDLKKSVPARFRTANRRRESFEANWEHFFYAAFGIGFRVFPRFDNPRKMSDNRRQWADFLAALATLLHRQYKTARTETRWHLLLKIRQMPIQTSASRGYVLFRSADKRCTKVLKLSADCGHSPRSVPNLERHSSSRMPDAAWLEIPDFTIRIVAAGWQSGTGRYSIFAKSMPATFHARSFSVSTRGASCP